MTQPEAGEEADTARPSNAGMTTRGAERRMMIVRPVLNPTWPQRRNGRSAPHHAQPQGDALATAM